MTTKKPTILIIGKAGSGKTTLLELFKRYTNLTGITSSYAGLQLVWDQFNAITAYQYKNVDEAFDNKYKWRNLIAKLIDLYNEPNYTNLSSSILLEYDIYEGMRSKKEFIACVGMFDHVIFVDADKRVKKEDETMKIEWNDIADIEIVTKIDNNFTMMDFETQFKKFIKNDHRIVETCRLSENTDLTELIVNWADSVFPERTIENALKKMVMEEIPEFLINQNASELADIGILLYDIANLANIDLDKAIRDKMAINKNRKWTFDNKTGLLNHVETKIDKIVWATKLIHQLPDGHEGKNSWLLNHGRFK